MSVRGWIAILTLAASAIVAAFAFIGRVNQVGLVKDVVDTGRVRDLSAIAANDAFLTFMQTVYFGLLVASWVTVLVWILGASGRARVRGVPGLSWAATAVVIVWVGVNAAARLLPVPTGRETAAAFLDISQRNLIVAAVLVIAAVAMCAIVASLEARLMQVERPPVVAPASAPPVPAEVSQQPTSLADRPYGQYGRR